MLVNTVPLHRVATPILLGWNAPTIRIRQPLFNLTKKRPHIIAAWCQVSGGFRILTHPLENLDEPVGPVSAGAKLYEPRLYLPSPDNKDSVVAQLIQKIIGSFFVGIIQQFNAPFPLHISSVQLQACFYLASQIGQGLVCNGRDESAREETRPNRASFL